MNKQRFAVIIVALIGLIATFLPWYKIVQLGTISGMSSSGWFYLYHVYHSDYSGFEKGSA